MQEILKVLKSKIEEAEMHTKAHEDYAIEEVRQMVPKINLNIISLHENIMRESAENAEPVSQRLTAAENEYKRIISEIEKIKYFQHFLGLVEYDSTELLDKF